MTISAPGLLARRGDQQEAGKGGSRRQARRTSKKGETNSLVTKRDSGMLRPATLVLVLLLFLGLQQHQEHGA